MELSQAKTSKIVTNYGLILGVLMVLLGVIMYVTNNLFTPHWSFAVASFALFIGTVVYGIKGFKTENAGFLSLGEAIKVAVGIALIAGILAGIWTLLLSSVIEPDYADLARAAQKDIMLEKFPEMPEESVNKALDMSAKFTKPWITFPLGLVKNIFFGLLIGLVTGLILKQSRPYEP